MVAQTILDKFKKREKKGDNREATDELEAKLAEVAAQLAASQEAAAERERAAAGEPWDVKSGRFYWLGFGGKT